MYDDLPALAHTLRAPDSAGGTVEVTWYDSEDTHDREDVVVLVHGTGGSTAANFGFLFPVLAMRQRTVALDWTAPAGTTAPEPTPGDGQPMESAERTLELEDLALQIIAVLEEVATGADSRRVTLLGYSLGACAAAVVAARRPELLGRLVLLNGWARTDLQQLIRNDVWARLYALDHEALGEYTAFCAFGGPFLAGKTMAEIAPALKAQAFTPFTAAQMELNRRVQIAQEVEGIPHPTLVIGSQEDQMVPLRHQRQLFGAVPDARLAVIGTGHASVLERPSEISFHVQGFLDAPDRYDAGTIIPTPAP